MRLYICGRALPKLRGMASPRADAVPWVLTAVLGCHACAAVQAGGAHVQRAAEEHAGQGARDGAVRLLLQLRRRHAGAQTRCALADVAGACRAGCESGCPNVACICTHARQQIGSCSHGRPVEPCRGWPCLGGSW